MSQTTNTAPAPATAHGTVNRQKAPRTVKLRLLEVEAATNRSDENWYYWKQALEALAIIDRRRKQKMEERSET